MPLKTFFKIIFLSFYSSKLYENVVINWKHWGLGVLIRFSMLVSFLGSLFFFIFVQLIDFKSDEIQNFLNQIPQLKIINGKAELLDNDLKTPKYIGNNMIVVDLTSKTADKYSEFPVVFTSYDVVFNFLGTSDVSLPYNAILNDTDGNIINSLILTNLLLKFQNSVLTYIIVLAFPLASLIYFTLAVLRVGFYSLIANIFADAFKLRLKFKQLFRLGVIANIPSFMISNLLVILLGANTTLANQWIVTIIYLTYFIGGIFLVLKQKTT